MTGMMKGLAGLPLEDESRDVRGLHFPERVWFSPFGNNNTSMTPVVGTYYSFPFIVWEPCVLVGYGIVISASPSNDAILRIGLHDHNSRDFLPGNLLYGSPEFTGAPLTSQAAQVATGFSVPLKRGVYWAGYIFPVATTLTNSIYTAEIGAGVGGVFMRQLWTTYGNGATPNLVAGQDGTVATQTSLTDIPAPFGGAWLTSSNSPNKPAQMMFLTSRR